MKVRLAWRWSRVTFFVLLLLGLLRYWVPYDPTDTVPHDPESFRLARSIAEKGQFANPRTPSITMRILSSVGKRRRVARLVLRISARAVSAERVAPAMVVDSVSA